MIVPIAVDWLERQLQFPPGRRIMMVRQSWEDSRNGVFEAIIESNEELEEVPIGAAIPIGVLEISTQGCDGCGRSAIVSTKLREP